MFRYRPAHMQSPMSQQTSGTSPGAGSSPSADEEIAQRLLDRWYGNVNSIEAQPLDEFGIFSGLDWDGSASMGAPVDFSNVGNAALSGADSSIWESLVNQIKGTGT